MNQAKRGLLSKGMIGLALVMASGITVGIYFALVEGDSTLSIPPSAPILCDYDVLIDDDFTPECNIIV